MAKKSKIEVPAGIWVSIDPGTPAGIAVWDDHKLKHVETIHPPDADAAWVVQALAIAERVDDIFSEYEPTALFVEDCYISMHGKKSIATALTGKVLRLAMTTGMIIHAAVASHTSYRHVNQNFELRKELISPLHWKGNLQDRHVKQRVEEWALKVRYKLPTRISQHARCAIGIGIYVLKGTF